MPEWKSRKIRVTLDYEVRGSEDDGVFVSRICSSLAGLFEMKLPDIPGLVSGSIDKPEIQSILVEH